MKVKTTIYIHFNQWHWEVAGEYQIFYAKLEDNDHRVYVGSQEIEIEVPDDFDPRAQKIAALEKQKQKVMADYHKTVIEINERISKLQSLEFTA